MVELPDHWYVDQTTLRILGIGLLMIIAVYLWFCAFAKHRHMTIKGQKLVLPSWKFALAQMLISSVNWMVMGAIIWLLLGQSVNYFFVLGVLLVSSIAGVIVHIPAGIGVLEAVFIALLAGEHTSKGTIIAALLAYRVLYYFIPLLLALICYLLLESQGEEATGEKMKRRCEVQLSSLVCAFTTNEKTRMPLPDKRYSYRGKYPKEADKIVIEC